VKAVTAPPTTTSRAPAASAATTRRLRLFVLSVGGGQLGAGAVGREPIRFGGRATRRAPEQLAIDGLGLRRGVGAELVGEEPPAALVYAEPNLRRDGLEIFFFSTRPGGLGMQDLYSASRSSVKEPWSTAVNLGPLVNSAAPDTRPSLSWDGTTLYFGSGRPGGEGDSDHYVTTRSGD
jgi:hypothetical protein